MTLPTIATVLLSAFFVFASSIKLFAWQRTIFTLQLGMFERYGFDRRAMWWVGAVELGGALALLWQHTLAAPLGALALLATSLGAIYCHLRYDSWRDGVPAMLTALLSAWLLARGWPLLQTAWRGLGG